MAERQVLATLLLMPSTFEELPEGFNSDAFELPEYRKLFESLNDEMKKPSTLLDIKACLEHLPEQTSVINDITYTTVPLNGGFREGRAIRLMNHKPIAIESEEEITTLLNSCLLKRRSVFPIREFLLLWILP